MIKIKKLLKHFKNNLSIYITFFTGLLIISIIYYLQDVSPLGKNSLLTIDFFHQYGPMLGELYDKVKTGSNLIYSFSMGMGLPFIRNFANYLSSPLNLIIFIFKRDNLLTSFSIIIALRAVLSSCTLIYYLKKKFNKESLYLIPMGILYAFSAYFTAYYWNIMWLDGMLFLPLIILGIENIINQNKYLLYLISLAAMLISNYFIGYMICIFSIIYFLGYLLHKTGFKDIKKILKKVLIFVLSSLLAGGIAAIILVPLFLSLKTISATSDLWPTSQYYAFTFWEFLASHFTGVGSTILSSGISNAPNISTGVLTISLLFLFIINPKIKIKTKILYLSLLCFLVFSFFYAPLDFIWHALHVPNDLPYRYSFIYSFVLIIISAYSIINIEKLKTRYVTITYILTVILISLLHFFKYNNIESQIIILNFILITIYFILYLIYKNFPVVKKYVGILLIFTCTVECIISVNQNWNITHLIEDFYQDYSPIKNTLNSIQNNENSLMYRVERNDMMTFNDPSWYGYNGQTTFSSMAYENLAVLQHKLGMPGNNINSYYYKQNTPIYDLLFNIKYFIGESTDLKRYTMFYNEDNIVSFKSNYNAGLMFAVNKEIIKWNINNDNPFEIQNDFIKKGVNIENTLEKLMPIKSELLMDKSKKIMKYTYNNPNDNIYFYTNKSDIDFIIINDKLYYYQDSIDYYKDVEEINVQHYKSYKEEFVINTNEHVGEIKIYIGYNNYRYDSFNAYTINDNKFNEAANIMINNSVLISENNEHKITGFINAKEASIIYTSIPYDIGWNVYINGTKIKTFKIGNSLLAFDILPGENHIELKYRSKGIIVGGVISLTSIIIVLAISSRKKNLKQDF